MQLLIWNRNSVKTAGSELTNEKHKGAREHAAKHGEDESSWRPVLLAEITEDGNTEALKDVVGIEEAGHHLSKVGEDIAPSNRTRCPAEE